MSDWAFMGKAIATFANKRGWSQYQLDAAWNFYQLAAAKPFPNAAKRDDALRGHLQSAGFQPGEIAAAQQWVRDAEKHGIREDTYAPDVPAREAPTPAAPSSRSADAHTVLTEDQRRAASERYAALQVTQRIEDVIRTAPSTYWSSRSMQGEYAAAIELLTGSTPDSRAEVVERTGGLTHSRPATDVERSVANLADSMRRHDGREAYDQYWQTVRNNPQADAAIRESMHQASLDSAAAEAAPAPAGNSDTGGGVKLP
jgi:hypothetical protein